MTLSRIGLDFNVFFSLNLISSEKARIVSCNLAARQPVVFSASASN